MCYDMDALPASNSFAENGLVMCSGARKVIYSLSPGEASIILLALVRGFSPSSLDATTYWRDSDQEKLSAKR